MAVPPHGVQGAKRGVSVSRRQLAAGLPADLLHRRTRGQGLPLLAAGSVRLTLAAEAHMPGGRGRAQAREGAGRRVAARTQARGSLPICARAVRHHGPHCAWPPRSRRWDVSIGRARGAFRRRRTIFLLQTAHGAVWLCAKRKIAPCFWHVDSRSIFLSMHKIASTGPRISYKLGHQARACGLRALD